jgi:hypothetical protein
LPGNDVPAADATDRRLIEVRDDPGQPVGPGRGVVIGESDHRGRRRGDARRHSGKHSRGLDLNDLQAVASYSRIAQGSLAVMVAGSDDHDYPRRGMMLGRDREQATNQKRRSPEAGNDYIHC